MTRDGKSSGKVASDPATTFPIGSELLFKSFLLSYTPPSGSAWVRDWDSLDGILLTIQFSTELTHRIEGSAVIVAPGIALCAAHVVEPKIPNLMQSLEAITCFGITRKGLQIWRTKKITIVPNTDLAILGLELATELNPGDTLFQSVITTRLPKIGERVTIFGFRAAENEFKRENTHLAEFSGNVLVCAGEVVERYITGRDRVMMPWPVLEVACPSWGGMSGGPVFDSNGKVLGLLSSSFTTHSNDGPSYISLLIPSLTTQFEGGWPAPLFKTRHSLLDIDPRLCHIDNRDAFTVSSDETTGQTSWSYRIWE